MTTFLDIIQSTIIGGIILLITLNSNLTLRQSWATYNYQSIVQDMLITTAQILECDLRNMGCGVNNATTAVTEARDTTITFRKANSPDYNPTISDVKYWSGGPNEAGANDTDNPDDRWLWRDIDGTTEKIGLVTQFRLKYLDQFGDSISTPVAANELINIRLVEITMEVQSPYPAVLDPDKIYATALWKQTRLASQNLFRMQVLNNN